MAQNIKFNYRRNNQIMFTVLVISYDTIFFYILFRSPGMFVLRYCEIFLICYYLFILLGLKQGIVEDYRKSTILTESPTFRVYVGRMTPDFANDVMEIYKKPLQKLRSPFSVKFENETSIGSGPVREFFSILMSMVIHGFPLDGEVKPVTLIFEGENDHKVPVANSLLRSTGFYKLVGRMIAHSFLHSGLPVFGISQAIVDCMVAENDEEIPSVQVADISDIDLRNALLEVGYMASLINIKDTVLFVIFEKCGKLQILL